MKRFLVVRPDRIGDVILTTPLIATLKKKWPDSQVAILVRKEVAPLLKGVADEILIYDPRSSILELARQIRSGSYDVAVVAMSRWRIALSLLLAGIPKRVGPLSKIHSYFLYNLRVRQRRSKSARHEAEYGLDLLSKLGISESEWVSATRVNLSPESQERARNWLRDQGVLGKNWIAVHPGMGGSALNWPESHYRELVSDLTNAGYPVLLTGSFAERQLLQRVGNSKAKVFVASSQEGIDFLGGLFKEANLVVAPSTGPLHLAVALGKPVVSFYPPIRVQSSKRWGPFGASKTLVLEPQVDCGQGFHCIGSACRFYPCMDTLSPKQVFEWIKKEVGKA